MLPGMEAQADALGMVRLGPGSLGNREIASTMPIIRAGADVFRTMANQMEDDWDAAYRTGAPNPITPDAFKEQYWNRSILATAAAYYGADEKNIVTLLLDEQAYWQRKFAAETKLNFNPGAWVKNFLTGNVTGLVEGAGSLAPTDDYRATLQGAYNLQGPWAQGASRVWRAKSPARRPTWAPPAAASSAPPPGPTACLANRTRMPAAPSTPAALSKTPRSGSSTTPVNLPGASTPGCPSSAKSLTLRKKPASSGPASPTSPAPASGSVSGKRPCTTVSAPKPATSSWPKTPRSGLTPSSPACARTTRWTQPSSTPSSSMCWPTPAPWPTTSWRATSMRKSPPQGRSPDFYRDWIGSEILPANLDLHNAALKAGRATGTNIMLDTSLQSNADQWLGWIAEFSYFATHTAINWAVAHRAKPGRPGRRRQHHQCRAPLQRRSWPHNEQQERPARYEQSVPLPGGLAMPNPVTQATGIDKLFINAGAESEFAEADTW